MSLAVEEARIFAAARRLARDGASFTMHELARAAGMSRATLYRRVRGREQLARRPAARGLEAPPSTRERTLAAGRALVVEQGVAALTVEAIAARAGVAATTVYREFGDRQALLRAVFKSELRELMVAASKAEWEKNTNITDATEKAAAEANEKLMEYMGKTIKAATGIKTEGSSARRSARWLVRALEDRFDSGDPAWVRARGP